MDPLCSTGIHDVQFAAMLQHIKHHLNFSLLQHTHTHLLASARWHKFAVDCYSNNPKMFLGDGCQLKATKSML